jgi:hypothetical protein
MTITQNRKNNGYLWLLPSFAAMSFIVFPILVIFQPDIMLNDPGIGWHLVSGHYMIDHKEILRHDIFSFTRPGQQWITYEWLFQYIAAGLENIGGLPILTYKRMVKDGVNIYIAILLLFFTFFALLSHCHARPHIFTYFFFILLLDRIFLFEQNRIPARSLFLFVPVMILWVNLHGGFLAGLAVTGIAFLVSFAHFLYSKDLSDKHHATTYFFFGFALFIASLINPFGWNLHLSIFHYLNMDSLHKMAEYVSPNFNITYSVETVFEFFILSFFLLTSRKNNKITLLELTLILFFIYQSLHAVRHIFLFCLLAIPILGKELTRIINKYDNWFTRRSHEIASEQKRLKSDWLWIPFICILLVMLSLTASDLFKKDLYGQHLTSGAGTFIENNIEKFTTPFNTETIGGALIYHFWPEMKIFADDRVDFYGDAFYLDEFMQILFIKPDWEDILKKYDITSAIISNQTVATLMEASPNWDIVYKDKKNAIFLRTANEIN